jgi:hypothetical protein
VAAVWLAPEKPESSSTRTRLYATLVGTGLAVGALVGSLITALVLR